MTAIATSNAAAAFSSDELLSAVLDASNDGVMAFKALRDANGRIVDFEFTLVNAAAARIVGRSAHRLLGRRLLDEFPGNKTDGLFDRYVRVVETGQPDRFEHYYEHDGLRHWFLISAVRVGDGFSVTFLDITQTKLAFETLERREAELERLNAELARATAEAELAKQTAEAANAAKSLFLAHISHELRTPMTAILGFADILTDPDVPREDASDAVKTIRRNARSLLQLLNDILDLSKVEAGRLSVERVPTDLRRLLRDIGHLLQPTLSSKPVRLTVSVEDDVPAVVLTDPLRVRQITMNLLSNAIKFTPQGEVTVRLSFTPPHQLTLCVRDTGVGMDDATLAKLFTPFTQGDASTSRRFGGTGLGLAISKKLAELLGGDISVSSELGKGSEFTVRLSCPPADDPAGAA
ncbi:MAG: PAS domain-containing sensor histidine kinase [Tepidisphaerales bacterium]